MTDPTVDPIRLAASAASVSWARRGLATARAVLRALFKACFVALGFVLMLGTLLLGLLLVAMLVAWGLLRGRRPAAGVFKSTFERARQRSAAPRGQVIDVEVREVPDPALPARKP